MRTISPRVLIVLTIGVLAVSTAAIIIREITAPALSIAAWRLIFASLPALGLLPLRGRRELRRVGRNGVGWALLSGACLALHFISWIASLQMTTVASSVVFVTISPLFVATFDALRGEPPSRLMLLAIAVCIAGGALIGGADLAHGTRSLEGDLLAIAGAFFVAIYFALGRRLRASLSLTTYTGVVYPAAALLTLLAAIGARRPMLGLDATTYGLLVLLALVPQVIGHSSLNWALGYLSAPFVAIAVLGEPVISTVLAALVLDERPGALQALGGMVLLAGVWIALRAEHASAQRAKALLEATGAGSLPITGYTEEAMPCMRRVDER
jgi:drug/metabolite transporter (DMT)-like permease